MHASGNQRCSFPSQEIKSTSIQEGAKCKKVEEVSANEKQPGSRDLTERDLKAGLIYRR